jgi:pyrroline-5-carboxylate reductase
MRTRDHERIGIFGAGKLGQSIAAALVNKGFVPPNLSVCHRGSQETLAKLTSDELVRRSTTIFYSVRPQDYTAIQSFKLSDNCLFVSCLAGVPLAKLEKTLNTQNAFRAMLSAPDTVRTGIGLSGVFPSPSEDLCKLLWLMGIDVVPLASEDQFHSFTVYGLCLPVVVAYWEELGRSVDQDEIVFSASKHSLPEPSRLWTWSIRAKPYFNSVSERMRYFSEISTKGGIMERILEAIDNGDSFSAALEAGLVRSIALERLAE